jgi:hypothetical protein
MKIRTILIAGLIMISPTSNTRCNYTDAQVSNAIIATLAGIVLATEAYCIYYVTNDIYLRLNKKADQKTTKDSQEKLKAKRRRYPHGNDFFAVAPLSPIFTSDRPSIARPRDFSDTAMDISNIGMMLIAALLAIDCSIMAYQHFTPASTLASESPAT